MTFRQLRKLEAHYINSFFKKSSKFGKVIFANSIDNVV